MKKEITILIQLDACRFDYITKEHTPFLFSISKLGYSGILKPTYGFEPDAAYIAGLYPDESDGGAQFWFDPYNSPFKYLKFLSKTFNFIPTKFDKIIRRFIEKFYRIKVKSPVFSTAAIPFNLLHYFSFPMKYRIDDPRFVKKDSVFDILRKNNLKWLVHCLPEYSVDIKEVTTRVKTDLLPSINFAYLLVGNLDKIGHAYGPDSNELRDELKYIDKKIHDIYNIVSTRFDNINLVIFGDHGMLKVEKSFNILDILNKLTVKMETDYLVFLDSTQARFWFFNNIAEREIINALKKIKIGHILSDKEKEKYHLNYKHNRFGDLIFYVDPGIIFLPNFYQKNRIIKGMHGYIPETQNQKAAILIKSDKFRNNKSLFSDIDIRQIYPTVLKLINIKNHNTSNLKSIL